MEELEKKVAERLNIDEEQVHIVLMDLFAAVKFYIYQPHLVKLGVMLNGFIKINLNFKGVKRYIESYKQNLLKYPRLKWSIQYWEQVLNKKDYYGNPKRERKSKKDNS